MRHRLSEGNVTGERFAFFLSLCKVRRKNHVFDEIH